MRAWCAVLMVAVLVPVGACKRRKSSTSKVPLVEHDAGAAHLPGAYWRLDRAQPILDKTRTTRLDPDLSQLTVGERSALAALLEAGQVFQELYEEQRHADAGRIRAELAELPATDPDVAALRQLYRLFQGPIAITLDNQQLPFAPVDPWWPGRNVYPPGATRAEIDQFLAVHPDQRDTILAPRTVVRRVAIAELDRDLGALTRHPDLDALHPGLKDRLRALQGQIDQSGFYAVPYSVAYADQLVRAAGRIRAAAAAVKGDDPDLAAYLAARADALLSDDYAASDGLWVKGRYHHLNAELGSYETYDDKLYGVKTFFAASVLVLRADQTERLRPAVASLQRLESSLPYQPHGRVRSNIPIGVYDIVADFGQARGGNTASILPNEAAIVAEYGRTVLIRASILLDQEGFDSGPGAAWKAVVAADHAAELTSHGNLYRTLFHELGHYLGPHRTADGRDVDAALLEEADAIEEMKSDLVSLFVAEELARTKVYDDATLRSVYAAGISRVLQNVKPRRDQPYQSMQLVQWNWFLEHGLVSYDATSQRLAIDYARYHQVVGELLDKVLAIQRTGDKAAATALFDQYSTWKPDLHEVVAQRIRDARRYRYGIYTYAALGE